MGRQVSAATDQAFNAGVYSYSHSRGIFAGVAISGAALTIDNAANDALYQRSGLMASDIISGAVRTDDDAARRFQAAVLQGAGLAPASMTSSAEAPSSPQSSAPEGPRGPAAQAFPLQDSKPGSNPNGNPPN